MATRVTYLVFIFPLIFSFVFGGIVLGQILQEPGRDLHMLQFGDYAVAPTPTTTIAPTESMQILGLSTQYSASDPISIRVAVFDVVFDCGDLYITLYDASDKPVSQSSYFDQCFAQNNAALPIGENYSEAVEPGSYRIQVDMIGKQGGVISVEDRFTVV